MSHSYLVQWLLMSQTGQSIRWLSKSQSHILHKLIIIYIAKVIVSKHSDRWLSMSHSYLIRWLLMSQTNPSTRWLSKSRSHKLHQRLLCITYLVNSLLSRKNVNMFIDLEVNLFLVLVYIAPERLNTRSLLAELAWQANSLRATWAILGYIPSFLLHHASTSIPAVK